MIESGRYLQDQIITYIGNKRKLLPFIGKAISEIKKELSTKNLSILDGFSGSGIVSRYMKQFASELFVNDLEAYSYAINRCYLSNPSPKEMFELMQIYNEIKNPSKSIEGIITELYAPKDDRNIQAGERCFYTRDNARRIDTYRKSISELEEKKQYYFMAPLLYKASKHTNTSGIFKGFYKDKETGIGSFGGTGKNCLERIRGSITLPFPIFSNFKDVDVHVYQEDINDLVIRLPVVDVAYFDPPYNQHPYGSNYHILNTIVKNEIDQRNLSKVSGIPDDWNRSAYNKKEEARKAFQSLIEKTKAKYILISYNTEGILSEEELLEIVSRFGDVEIREQDYAVFKGSRNLRQRTKSVQELLFVLKKS